MKPAFSHRREKRRGGVLFRDALLLCFFAVALISSIVVGAYTSITVVRYARREILEVHRSLAAQIAASLADAARQTDLLTEWIIVEKNIRELLRKRPERAREYDATMRNALENLESFFGFLPVAHHISALWISGDNGLDLRYGYEAGLLDPVAVQACPWYVRGVSQSDYNAWGDLEKNPSSLSSCEHVIPTIRTIRDINTGRRLGFVLLLLDRGFLDACYRDIALPRGVEVYLVGPSGRVLASSRPDSFLATWTDRDSAPAGVSAPSSGAGRVLLVRERLKNPDIQVITEIDSLLLERQPQLVALSVGLVLAVALVVSGLLAFWLARGLGRPIGLLVDQVNAIARGEFDHPGPVSGVREVSDLGASVTGMAGDLKRMIEENRAKEQAKRAAEIHLLRSQMDPHFLSNALNTIRTMATLQGADGIARMAECLARIFRAKLGGRDETASVREELALLEDYMYIQRIRYSGRVTLRTQIADDAVLDCRILRFLLQPIVENAVFHGLEPKGSEGEIVVQVQRRDGVLLVDIRDDGVGMSDGAESSKGIGIRNIRERIALAYGDAYGMSIESRPGSYTEVRLRLPACAPPAASKPDAGGAA